MNIPFKSNECMADHCTFKTGGCAEILYIPETPEQLKALLKQLKEDAVPFHIIGRGSNILVSDSGIKGAVIKLGENFSKITMTDQGIKAECGASLFALASFALKHERCGLEFAAGIPGSVGGGVAMNAGAYGGEIKDVLYSAELLTQDGEIITVSNADLDLSYRHSRLQETGEIVLSAIFALDKGNREISEALMKEFAGKRSDKQPLNFPSAGSTFKRPEGYFAGTLIEQCGLKGCSIGGAQVSEKHAGFIINKGNATSRDIYELIKHVQKTVFEKEGVELTPEVRFLGEF